MCNPLLKGAEVTKSRYVEPPKNREEEEKLIQEYLKKGGEINHLRTPDKFSAKADKKEKKGAILVFSRDERMKKI